MFRPFFFFFKFSVNQTSSCLLATRHGLACGDVALVIYLS